MFKIIDKEWPKFFSDIVEYAQQNNSQATRTTREALEPDLETPSMKITIYRFDHYSGKDGKPEDGTFLYSTYAAIIQGIKIENKNYDNLVKILMILK